MSDIKLFRTSAPQVTELKGTSVQLEKSLQTLIEHNLETFLGVRFLASEFPTGRVHAGRIDTLGLDENGYPVIIEYKRAVNQNVINQGLFYLNWLMDHKADFKLLVMDQLGSSAATQIEWSSPRLICIAGEFTKFDEEAIHQMNRNIELIRYRKYGDDFLLLELVNASHVEVSALTFQVAKKPKPTNVPASVGANGATNSPQPFAKPKGPNKSTVTELIEQAGQPLRDLYETLKAELLAMGDDVQMQMLSQYVAFKRIKNFACVEVHPNSNNILIYLKVNPDTVHLEQGFTRDVRKIGHFGTGDLEVRMSTAADLERARAYILRSYDAS